MSAKTRQVQVAHFSVLSSKAIELLNDPFEPRDLEQTKVLIRAVQLYKEDRLGSVEAKLAKGEHLKLLFDVICGSSSRLPSLIYSLCEFGVSEETCQQIVAYGPKTLQDLWRMKIADLYSLVGNDPNKVTRVQGAFLKLQKKVGILKKLGFPGVTAEELRGLHGDISRIYYKDHPMDD